MGQASRKAAVNEGMLLEANSKRLPKEVRAGDHIVGLSNALQDEVMETPTDGISYQERS